MSRRRDTSRPQRFLVDRMRSIETVVTDAVHGQVTQGGAQDLSVAHARLLAELRGGSRPSDLAKRLGVTKGAIGQLVDRLEGRGYVTRVSDPTDRRAYLIRPSLRTKAAYRVARNALLGIEDEWRRILGPDRMSELERALEILDGWRPEFAHAAPTTHGGRCVPARIVE